MGARHAAVVDDNEMGYKQKQMTHPQITRSFEP